jgi:release factor glutamine methyltransferase
VAGEPLEQILGWVEFCGLRVEVDRGVFVPRRRTELLVREAVAVTSPRATVVDLCCGAGAVGLAIATAVGDIDLYAVDIDPVAVRCAVRNLDPIGGHVLLGDLDAPLPPSLADRVDVIVANAPYVPAAAIPTLPREARDHEPRTALDGGSDGVDVHRRIAGLAPTWLRPGGTLLIETSEHQVALTAAAVQAAGLLARVSHDDADATVVIGRY